MEELYNNKKRFIIYLILFVISIFYILIYLRPTLIDFDESYTLELINHNFRQIIYFDSMDVHPPLYYVLVKIFIAGTTFWTSYFPLKILSARLFSVITSIITFVFLRKITIKLNVSNNIISQWILFLLLPNVLGIGFPAQQLSNIRMYSLAGMFITIEFYYLIKFYYEKTSYLNLIIFTVSAICASYTHYYAAVFGGLFLFSYFVKYCIKKDLLNSIKLFLSGVIFALTFVPWLRIFLIQFNNSHTYWMTMILEAKEIIEFLVILLIFIFPIYKYAKRVNRIFRDQMLIIIPIIVVVFLIVILYSIFKAPIFQYRYMYPILIIYEFLGINVILKDINSHQLRIIGLIILTILSCNLLLSTVKQTTKVDPNSFHLIKVYNCWENIKSDSIIVKPTNNINDINYVSFMSSFKDKHFIVPDSFKTNSHIYSNPAYRFTYQNVLKNIKFK